MHLQHMISLDYFIERGRLTLMHPDTVLRYINEEIGFGVFAAKKIPKGTMVWALDNLDQMLEQIFVQSLDTERKKQVMKYSYRNNEGKYILCWDIGRYVNHSFHANCIGTPYNFDIAVRDIFPGDELTNDYGSLNLEEPFECFPEEGTDRVRAMPDDILKYFGEWDRFVLEAYAFFHCVEQPLIHFLPQDYQEKVRISAQKRVIIDSIKSTYFSG